MSTPRLVLFRDASQGSVLDPAAAQAVALLQAAYAPAAAGGIDVQVTGIAKGLNTVTISLNAAGQQTQSTVTPDATTGLYAASFAQLALPRGSPVALEAVDSTAAVRDRAAFVLGEAPDLIIPAPTSAGAGVRGPRFLGGNVDRLVRSRFFSPLHAEPKQSIPYAFVGLIEADRDGVLVSVKELSEKVKEPIERLQKQAADGKLSLDAFLDKRVDAYAQAAVSLEHPLKKSGSGKPSAGMDRLLPQIGGTSLSAENEPKLFPLRDGKGALTKNIMMYGPVSLASQKRKIEYWQQLFGKLLGTGTRTELPVGILFDDRVRFQPAGLVLGEEAATLSLAPGEEVQVRQTVETKRRATVEDVKDRETERQFTMSSTWSTDITASMQETDTRGTSSTIGADLGADLGDALPIPVNVGGSGSFNATTANTTSANTSRTDHIEATATASARLRAQHKLRVEVTTEDASSLASTRTIRNANPLRGVTYVFFKVYRKERVSLERYGARLCLSLDVTNPSRDTRAAFVEGLRKLDPDNSDNYRLRVPKVVTAKWSVQLDGSTANTNGAVSHGEDTEDPYSTERFTIGPTKLKAKSKIDGTLAIDPAFMLTETPTVKITQFKDKGNVTRHGAAEFDECGGAVTMDPLPQVRAQDPDITLVADITSWGEGQDDGHAIHHIDAEVTSRWGPTDTDALAYAEAVAGEREQLQSQLSMERLLALRDIAVAQYEGTVLSRAVEHYFNNVSLLTEVADIFDVGDLFIRSTPHWATKAGRARYRKLRYELDRLPILVTADDLLPVQLTSSKATIFLPVREGREADALRLLKQFPANQIDRIVGNLQQFRAATFPDVPRQAMTYDQVMSPLPPSATLLGANAWANEWEQPAREFQVLGQWSEVLPTDGVHLEMLASDTLAADEARRQALIGGE